MSTIEFGIGGIHKRRPGRRGFAKSVQGGRGVFELCTYTFLKMRAHHIFFVHIKVAEKVYFV